MARFLAVGDPIYNAADPRWNTSAAWFTRSTYAQGGQLNRLPGTGKEVQLAAQAWTNANLLIGADARKGRFLSEVSGPHPPAIIHLATHVITSGTNEAFLAFGLAPNGQPETLGTSELALLRIPGSLVVMTGCDSAGGDVRASIGLENLTRSWVLAGARAVVATEWPVRDSGGEFFANFYRFLHEQNPAEALRRAQTTAIHTQTAESRAAVWASYQLYGGAQ